MLFGTKTLESMESRWYADSRYQTRAIGTEKKEPNASLWYAESRYQTRVIGTRNSESPARPWYLIFGISPVRRVPINAQFAGRERLRIDPIRADVGAANSHERNGFHDVVNACEAGSATPLRAAKMGLVLGHFEGGYARRERSLDDVRSTKFRGEIAAVLFRSYRVRLRAQMTIRWWMERQKSVDKDCGPLSP